jgi:hypothetical protein
LASAGDCVTNIIKATRIWPPFLNVDFTDYRVRTLETIKRVLKHFGINAKMKTMKVVWNSKLKM